MNPTEPAEEIWVFGGSRIDHAGRRVHAWLPSGSDDELWFKARGSYAPGTEYQVRVTRHDGTTTRHGAPVYVGRHSNDTLRVRLDAQHRAAEIRLRLTALERNDKRHAALDAALEPLCGLIRSLPPADRDAVLAYVLRRLSRAW